MTYYSDIPDKPSVWDLSDIYPAFYNLNTSEKHKELLFKADSEYKRLRADYIAICSKINSSEPLEHDTLFRRLKENFDSAYRMERWFYMYGQEFYKDVTVYKFCQEQREKMYALFREMRFIIDKLPEKIKTGHSIAKWLFKSLKSY